MSFEHFIMKNERNINIIFFTINAIHYKRFNNKKITLRFIIIFNAVNLIYFV